MARLKVAVIPSIQDTNRFPHPVTGAPYNELIQMHRLAEELLVYNSHTSGVTGMWMRIFTGRPYSDVSSTRTWRDNLRAQQREAFAWLEGSSEPTVALNLHSDGVNYTHVGYYWDGAAANSRDLGKLIAEREAPVFNTTKILNANYGAQDYIFAQEMKSRHCPVLLELGDHLVKADNLVLWAQGEKVAQAIVDTLVAYFKLPTPPVVEDPWFRVDSPHMVEYAKEHNLLPNLRARALWRKDEDGDEFLKLSTGNILMYRKYTDQYDIKEW